ncbi:MAG TPA: dTDP-glucose 4,6-dehydratase [candidate division Zixibacteria bacterium]|nr:dTDP-glucose 4,6-dehydratase [candidate division Zixibacteria bacterium]
MNKQAYTPQKGIVITGAAGFIGSAFMPLVMSRFHDTPVYALDALTYAGSRDNLTEFDQIIKQRGCASLFSQLDITDYPSLEEFFKAHEIDTVINFAAETHVDRSLARPDVFFHSNVIGTACLLKVSRERGVRRFVQISTDEVYGPTPEGVEFNETAPLNPSSPYAASKAAADLAVLSYVHSYNFPALIVRGTNNYGPRQYPEKVIPFFIARALGNHALPLYGDGLHERDWIYVEDFCRGVLCALELGADGAVYNISGGARLTNKALVKELICLLKKHGVTPPVITHVADRPGHDRRYRINCEKIRALGFAPETPFSDGLARAVNWFFEHRDRLREQVERDVILNNR